MGEQGTASFGARAGGSGDAGQARADPARRTDQRDLAVVAGRPGDASTRLDPNRTEVPIHNGFVCHFGMFQQVRGRRSVERRSVLSSARWRAGRAGASRGDVPAVSRRAVSRVPTTRSDRAIQKPRRAHSSRQAPCVQDARVRAFSSSRRPPDHLRAQDAARGASVRPGACARRAHEKRPPASKVIGPRAGVRRARAGALTCSRWIRRRRRRPPWRGAPRPGGRGPRRSRSRPGRASARPRANR